MPDWSGTIPPYILSALLSSTHYGSELLLRPGLIRAFIDASDVHVFMKCV